MKARNTHSLFFYSVARRMVLCCVALLIVVFSGGALLPQGWTDENGTKSARRKIAVNMSSKGLESPKGAMEPTFALIERVQITDLGQHVEIRVVGSGPLSCAPFPLADPDRLVLDCTGAHVQARLAPIRVDVAPVRAVRVGQLKTDVARVVIDLEGQSTYTIHTVGNAVTVVFDSQSSGFDSTSKQLEPAPRPVEAGGELVPQVNAPIVPDNVPAPRNVEVASAGITNAQASPPDRLVSTPVTQRSAPVVASGPPNAHETRLKPDTPAEKLGSTPPDQDYVIGPQDVLAINVWREAELSRSVPVRPDGKISLPLVGELKVSGLTPRLLETHLAKELETYIHNPQVTVIIQEANSHKFYIIGEVEHPGAYPLTTRMTVLNALATAGGFRDFAKVQQIYLLRLIPDGSRKRLHFDYKAAVNGKNSYQDLELQTGDTLVVP